METAALAAEPQHEWMDFVHTGPGTLAGRYLRMSWQPVALSADLPDGRAIPIRIMSEDLTLYRGEAVPHSLPQGDGTQPTEGDETKAHLLAFRCAHRGTQLSTGWVEGDDLRCFYHGWKYDATGQCIEQPAEPEPFCQRIRIRAYPVQEYLGLIFAYLGDGDPPPMWHFPDFEAEGLLDARTTPVWPCNFFNRVDNDPVHVAFVHRDGPYQRGIPLIQAEENDSGMLIHSTHSDGTTGQSYHHMPNVSHFTARPRVMLEGGARVTGFRQSLGFRIPVDDGHHKVLSVDHVRVSGEVARSYAEGLQDLGHWSGPDLEALGEAVLRGEFHSDDIEDRRNITQVQDYAALVGQGRIADHSNEHLGASDRSVIFFRQLWMRELRALAEGRPLKQWKGAGELSALRDP